MSLARVSYTIGRKTFEGAFVLEEKLGPPRPLILMSPNWMGVTIEVIERTRRLLGDKYIGFVVDMCGDGKIASGADEARALATDVRANAAEWRSRMGASLEALNQKRVGPGSATRRKSRLSVSVLAAETYSSATGFGIAAHGRSVRQRAFGAHRVGGLIDFLRQRLGTGQSENKVDAVGLAPVHRLGSRVVAVASKGDARLGPTPANMAHKPAQMGAHFDARRRLAGAEHDRDEARALGVVDVDRQKAALVVMGVEQRELLMSMHDIAGVVDIEHDERGLALVGGHLLIDERIGQTDRVLQRRRVL